MKLQLQKVLVAGLAALVTALVAVPVAIAQDGIANRDFFAQVDGHFSLLTDTPDRSIFAPGLGYNARAGWRFADMGVFLQAGQSSWLAVSTDREFVPGVLNIGLGGEYRFLAGNARISAAAGTSTLVYDAVFDSAGTTGWFANLRPIGLRWALTDNIVIQLDPITFTIMQPAVRTPRLTRVEYQTVLALELQ